ncbi:MAG: transaldolase, partial [Planctomycetales bacterium]|nr:transaldolase [Planctomycetales bacterium]
MDSAKVDEITYALNMWNIDGVTTNPRHVNVSGKPFLTVINEIAEIFKGTDKAVS